MTWREKYLESQQEVRDLTRQRDALRQEIAELRVAYDRVLPRIRDVEPVPEPRPDELEGLRQELREIKSMVAKLAQAQAPMLGGGSR